MPAPILSLLPDYNYSDPIADDDDVNSYFPNQPGNGVSANYWTAIAYVPTPGQFWYIDMRNGLAGGQAPATGSYVRCVSGETMPDAGYTDQVNGTIFDSTTNLVFTQCTNDTAGVPTGGSDCTTGTATQRNWVTALADCDALDLSSDYWTSSTNVGTVAQAWRMIFVSGFTSFGNKSNTYYVRCVRTGP